MKFKEEFESLKKKLLNAKAQTPGPAFAAFDADGTLWDTDMGEAFFKYQIDECNLDLPADPWKFYDESKEVDAPKAYLWLAQINKGKSLKQVQAWAEEAFLKSTPFPFFQFQKDLISFLHDNDFKVYVVTASVKWAVEPGAKRLGISADHVLGVKTKIENGIVTDVQDGPITYRAGKADAILQTTQQVRPLLCAGNTPGDTQLLKLAEIPIAIVSHKKGERIYESEQQLQVEAKKNNWLSLDFSSEY